VDATDKDVLKNLQVRGNPSPNDPSSIEEIRKRRTNKQGAERQILSMPYSGKVNVIRIVNRRQEDPPLRECLLKETIRSIMEKLLI